MTDAHRREGKEIDGHVRQALVDCDLHGAEVGLFESNGQYVVRLDFPDSLHFIERYPLEWAAKHPQAMAELFKLSAEEAIHRQYGDVT